MKGKTIPCPCILGHRCLLAIPERQQLKQVGDSRTMRAEGGILGILWPTRFDAWARFFRNIQKVAVKIHASHVSISHVGEIFDGVGEISVVKANVVFFQ